MFGNGGSPSTRLSCGARGGKHHSVHTTSVVPPWAPLVGIIYSLPPAPEERAPPSKHRAANTTVPVIPIRMASNVLLLEHVNLNLPRERTHLARSFYLDEGLGLVEDPRPASMGKEERLLWADAGLQQFHLPLVDEGNAEGDAAPQLLRGEVGLPYASAGAVADVMARVRALTARPAFAGTRLSVADAGEDGSHTVTCPYGGRYVLFALPPSPGVEEPRLIGGPADARGHPPPLAPPASIARPLGLQWLRLDVPAGAAPALARFWGDVLGAGVSAREGAVRVHAATAAPLPQHIDFVEQEGGGVPWDGHHVCLYVTDFEGAYRRCEAEGVLFDPGRFSDRGGTWELAQVHEQFRVLHVPPAAGGTAGAFWQLGLAQAVVGQGAGVAPAYTLELEVRSVRHPSFPAGRAKCPG